MLKTKKQKIIAITISLILVLLVVLGFVFYKKSKLIKNDLVINVSSFKNNFGLKDLSGRLGSFTENFSGTGWRNKEETSVYHDSNSLILSLPVKYELKEFTPQEKVEIQEDSSEECIQDKCLFLQKDMLYQKNNDRIDLLEVPFKVDAVGKTDTFWLLASLKEQEENKMSVTVYTYDGKKYNKLVGEGFLKSGYKGEFLLGGSDIDFIAGFYGFGSKILRFKQKNECINSIFYKTRIKKVTNNLNICYESEDVSHWFSSRIARIQNVDFLKYGKHYVFYSKAEPFFGLTDNNFLMDLTSNLNLSNYRKALVKYYQGKILITAEKKNQKKYFEFNFLGFDKSKTVSWVSSSLIKEKPKGVAITSYTGSKDGGDIKFYFSNNNSNWTEVKPGENLYFKDGEKVSGLYWKADLIPGAGDDFASPFLGQVSMTYAK